MAIGGKQKAAMLLMGLDPVTATTLLKGMDTETIQDIALEIAQIDSTGQRNAKNETKIVQEFYNSLRRKESRKLNIRSFLNEMLVNILGKEKTAEINLLINEVTEEKDWFREIRSANIEQLALAMENQHPQTVAVVLSELSTEKCQEIMALLDKDLCAKVVCKMTNPEPVSPNVKQRIASTVNNHLESFEGVTIAVKPKQLLRRLAIMLSGLEKDLRDRLLGEIDGQDSETATTVRNLMITWEDIPTIADRSLQEALRGVESGKLAIAFHEADDEIEQKIRSNISERAAAMLDEEIGLMQEPLEKEVLEARELVIVPLREANEAGTLRRA